MTITQLHETTTMDLPVDRILTGAMSKDLTSVLVIGREENGEYYFAASSGSTGEAVWLMEKCRQFLLQNCV